MSTSRLMQMAAAGAGNHPAPLPIGIEDYFSTYLYTGNGSTQTITNGIDLAGEGGMVWVKNRTSASYDHYIVDSETGNLPFALASNSTRGKTFDFSPYSFISALNSDGFSIGNGGGDLGDLNASGSTYASWTFRKAPRFFDVVTWTGDGTSERVISHSLGVTPGAVIIKATSTTGDWWFTHRLVGTDNGSDLSMRLNATGAATTFGIRASTDSSTTFTLRGANNVVYANSSGVTYVAYLFAHDPLGPSGDGSDGLIACGSYTGNGSTDGPEINLGWEPQWLLVKRTDASASWFMIDNMRGFTAGSGDAYLLADSSQQETITDAANDLFSPQASGFKVNNTFSFLNASGGTYIYIAIRRGPMRQPTSGTEVFAIDTSGVAAPWFDSGFPVDMAFWRQLTTDNTQISSRITGPARMYTNLTSSEGSSSAFAWDFMDGWYDGGINSSYSWMFRRAPGFFDVVAYTGGNLVSGVVKHNLGVKPEMVIIKQRNTINSINREWAVGAPDILGINNNTLSLNNNYANGTLNYNMFNTVDGQTSTQIKLHGNENGISSSAGTYIAYLFATLPGVSKVGSYTGNGSSQTIDCGFTSGARFVLIKRTDSTGDWYVWDTARGIVTGNDPHLSLNTTAAEVTTDDSVDPEATGFIVNQDAATNINVNAASYIFLAIA